MQESKQYWHISLAATSITSRLGAPAISDLVGDARTSWEPDLCTTCHNDTLPSDSRFWPFLLVNQSSKTSSPTFSEFGMVGRDQSIFHGVEAAIHIL